MWNYYSIDIQNVKYLDYMMNEQDIKEWEYGDFSVKAKCDERLETYLSFQMLWS